VIDQQRSVGGHRREHGPQQGQQGCGQALAGNESGAAVEVGRQLRLRNMGGLIVVDFIDMKHRRDQQAVYKAMMDNVRRDKAKTQILPISQFGLMEMTAPAPA